MDDKLAVDIVLLPPNEASDKIISLVSSYEDGPTKLNQTDCLPHISLMMGVIDSSQLDIAKSRLNKLSQNLSPIILSANKIESFEINNGPVISELIIEYQPELWQLHKQTMAIFKDLLTDNEVTIDQFITPPMVANQSISWVKNYQSHHQNLNQFKPHITLGEGKNNPLDKPIIFSSNQLALCHLGTYCTCRKILF